VDVDLTEQKRMDSLIMNVIRGTSTSSGNRFFEDLVQALADTLDPHFAFVGEFADSDRKSIRTVSVWSNGRFGQNFEYLLEGSPCEGVLKGEVCLYSEGVADLFPDDKELKVLGVESYLGSPLRDLSGEVIGLLVVMDDKPMQGMERLQSLFQIFAARAGAELEKIRAEKRRSDLEVQLRQAQKMEAVGTLAGGIAHDFNNILTAIQGNSDLLLERRNFDSFEEESLEDIVQATIRAKNLVAQILTFSRREVPNRVNLSLGKVVDETIRLLRASLPAGIRIERTGLESRNTILADGTQIQQAIVNLCTNASHAMENDRGLIEISLRETDGSDWKEVSEKRPFVELSVRDNGSGMEPDLLKLIFDPFFTTKEVGKGTGLGLAVVHGIVKSHDAFISVSSEVGSGTLFRILFPVSEELEKMKEELPTAVLTGKGQRILLVDDESMIVRMTSRLLERLNYEPVGFCDPQEAINSFEAAPDAFDLVLTDQSMPGMSGLDLVEAIRKVREDIPVVLCSGFLGNDFDERAERLGIRHVLQKPQRFDELSEVLGRLLEGK